MSPLITLKECFDEKGVYLGKHVVDTAQLTPEYLVKIRADKNDELGWKQHRKVMKEKGYDIE